MRHPVPMLSKRLSVAMLTATALLVVHGLATAEIPRTPWGDPDFRGTYTSDNWIGVSMQRPERFGTREMLTEEEYYERVRANEEQIARDEDPFPESEFSPDDPASINAPRHWLERPNEPSRATSLVIDPPDGRIPEMTSEGQRRAAERRRRGGRPGSFTDFSNYDRCISRGVAGSIIPVIYGNGTRIEQAPGYVVIMHEMIHEARVIPLDGRPHADEGVQMWMGSSRGHWEGETLVIETANFNGRTGVGANGGGSPHSERSRFVERLTPIGEGSLRYELTVHDPDTYARPWTLRFNIDAEPGYEIFEYACHEGNYGLPNMLSAARHEEALEAREAEAAR